MEICLPGSPADETTYYYTGGRPHALTRPSVVFIHGAGHDHSVWALQTRYFASHGWNVIAPDLPGHGRSGGQPLTRVEALADWIVSLANQVANGPVALVGHSMGSLIALQAAASAPDKVSRLVLVGSVAPMPVAAPLLDAALHAPAKAHAMINQWSYTAATQLGASPVPGLNLTAMNERLMQRQAEGVLHRDLHTCNAYGGGFDAAARVQCPTLLLSAAQDRMTPPKAIAPLAGAFPTTNPPKLVILPKAGHAMMSEAPGALLDALWNFLARPPD